MITYRSLPRQAHAESGGHYTKGTAVALGASTARAVPRLGVTVPISVTPRKLKHTTRTPSAGGALTPLNLLGRDLAAVARLGYLHGGALR